MSIRRRRWSVARPLALGFALTVAAACTGSPIASPSVSPGQPSVGLRASAPTDPGAATAPPPSSAASLAPVQLLGTFPEAELDKATTTRLDAALDQIVAGGAPDVLAAVITAEGSWSGAAGTVGPKGAAAAPTQVFSVASVTKTAVATLLLRLVELGEVDLDARIDSYVPDMAVQSNGATVRQALAMRGGFGETAGSVIESALADCSRAWTEADVVAAFPAPVSKPGSSFVYSNPGYKLAGYVAERVTGMSLGTALRTYVVEPAGVERFVLQGPGAPAPKPWALPIEGHFGPLKGADYGVGGTLPCLSDSTLAVGGTAMAADAGSLARWAWQLFAGQLINERSLAALIDIDSDDYGLGIWRFYDFPPDLAYGHAGNKPGFAPLFVVLPARQIVVVVCINDQDADPYAPVRALLRALDPA